MLQPVVRRTWALKGQTPVIKSWSRHDRLSVISTLTVSPVRQRIGLYFSIQDENFRWPHIVSFVRSLRRHVGPRLLIIWDRLNAHRSAQVHLREAFDDDIVFVLLPGYSPELNPVERVWSHTKYCELANNIPADIHALWRDVYKDLRTKRKRPGLLRSFFQHAGLHLK